MFPKAYVPKDRGNNLVKNRGFQESKLKLQTTVKVLARLCKHVQSRDSLLCSHTHKLGIIEEGSR